MITLTRTNVSYMPDTGLGAVCTKPFNSFMGKLEKKCKVVRCLAGTVLAEIHSEVFMADCRSGPKILFFYECIEEIEEELLEEDTGHHSRETTAERDLTYTLGP